MAGRMSFIKKGDSIKLQDVKTLKRSRHYHPGEIGWLSELMQMVEKTIFIDDLLYVAHPSVSYSASLQDLLIMVYKPREETMTLVRRELVKTHTPVWRWLISGIEWSKYNKQDGEKIIQISPAIADFLQKYDSTNKEFKFLDQCFMMLFGRLAKNSKEIYFDLIDLTLDQLIQISQQILKHSKNKQLPEHYYICLLRRVQDFMEFLDRADDRFDRETPEQLKQLLQHLDMHATDTWTLITRHLVSQQDLDGPKMGSLAVHVFIIKQKMTLKILSAHNLKPINETIKPEQQSSGAILFIVKDRVRIGQNKCLGQCVLPLKEVSLFDQPPNLNILPQVRLKLKWLLIADDKLFEIVKIRKNNEAAEKFIKKQALHTNALPVNLLNIDKYKVLHIHEAQAKHPQGGCKMMTPVVDHKLYLGRRYYCSTIQLAMKERQSCRSSSWVLTKLSFTQFQTQCFMKKSVSTRDRTQGTSRSVAGNSDN
uniref:(California timema) hypothetical protein n=1 Tax=Timema californicum TaxID=61474 RepID=A0A7R9IW60_TIMCA|nr:unnamed protein product [Timema californicum]